MVEYDDAEYAMPVGEYDEYDEALAEDEENEGRLGNGCDNCGGSTLTELEAAAAGRTIFPVCACAVGDGADPVTGCQCPKTVAMFAGAAGTEGGTGPGVSPEQTRAPEVHVNRCLPHSVEHRDCR